MITNGQPQGLPVPTPKNYYTTGSGCPILNPQSSQRIGSQLGGTALIQDINLIETIAHFTHERTPERVVHAKGAGAHGVFEVTADISYVTSADFLSAVGKQTPLFARFSTIAGERGSADTVRDSRGFAFKFYTDEGNLDWVFLNEPVFPIRDGGKLPSLVHANKRNPQTNLKDATMFWDYFNNNQEGMAHLMRLFSDAATPVSLRNADIWGANTYKFTKNDGSFSYVKLHLTTNQGIKNFSNDEAQAETAQDPDFLTRDLFHAIDKGDFPSWDVKAQIIPPDQAEKYPINIFDVTKTLPEADFPSVTFGKITLTRNPDDFFTEVEQAAFSPTSIVPGWEPSPDPVLQTRLFAYSNTQRYRLGVNFLQLPINAPLYAFTPLQRDGANDTSKGYGKIPPYLPTSLEPKPQMAAQYLLPDHEKWIGTAVNFASEVVDADFDQPREFWNIVLGGQPGQQMAFVYNVSVHLCNAIKDVRMATYEMFERVDKDLAMQIKTATEEKAS